MGTYRIDDIEHSSNNQPVGIMKITLWNSLPPRKRKLISWVLGLLFFYAILGFLILPPIIRLVAVKQLSAQLDRKVSIEKIKINPFAPSVTVRGLLILDKDGQPFVSWDEVCVNFQVSSVFMKAWTFREISVTAPYARAVMNPDYTFNFTDLIQKFVTNAPAAAPKQPSKPLLVRVRRLIINGARLSVADYAERTPFKRIIGPLDLNVDDFQTAPDNNSASTIAGTTDAGENFFWRGYFCLDPLRSGGRVTVDDVTLNKFQPLYEDRVPFEIRSGDVGFHAEYYAELGASNFVATVTNAAFGLNDFKIGLPGNTNDILDLFHLAVTGVSADLQTRQAIIDRIRVSGTKLFVLRNKDGSINLLKLLPPAKTGAAVQPASTVQPVPTPALASSASLTNLAVPILCSVTNTVAMLLNTTNLGIGVIREVCVTNCAVRLVDLANSRPATLHLFDISLEAKNLSNLPGTNITTDLSLRWNKNGSIALGVNALLSPLAVDVHLALDNIDFGTLDPYLESQVNLLIPDASFGMNDYIHVQTPPGGLPDVTFQGDVWLNDFRTVDGVTGGDLLKWDAFRVSGIDVNANPLAFAIKDISLTNASAYVVIATNGVINLLAALHPAVTNGMAQTKAPVAAKNPAPKATANLLAGLPAISISRVGFTNARFQYVDYSLTPNVNLGVEQASGTITGISTAELQHGNIAIHALVDGVGPVVVTGVINPFSGTETNQVKIALSSMDLLPTGPYSGKFAGYRIARGALSLNLEYDLVGRKLKAQNNITVKQFMFGEKVNSPDATKLPVRLAVALLKDREGNIVINVPIQGSLDDPKFRIGKEVMRVLENLLTKVATSPFSLLGAAFGGGGEELSYQDFVPGRAGLPEASRKKLDVLIKALYNRPGLDLEMSGSVDPAADRDGLQRVAFDKQLRTRVWMSLSKAKRALTTPDEMVLTAEERAVLVAQVYNDAVNSGQITPALINANTNLAAIVVQIQKLAPENEKLGVMLERESQAASAQMATGSSDARAPLYKLPPPADPREALLEALIPVSDSDLETLAIERAKAVRAYILASGRVEAGRLFLAQSENGGLRQDGCRVYLQLE
jgi:hypothetical protein